MDASATTSVAETTASTDEAQGLLSYWYPGLIACFCAVSVAIIVGNALTAFAYWTSPSLQKSLHNLLICNLSVADLIVAIIGTPVYILNYTEAGNEYKSTHKYGCLVTLFSMGTAVNMSLAAITVLCLERFIAVVWPYRYYTIVTDRSVRAAIVISYIISIIPTAPPLFGLNKWKEGRSCHTPYVYLPILVTALHTSRFFTIGLTVVMNAAIAKVAFTKSRTSVADCHSQEKADSDSQSAKQVTKMIMTVFGVYYACWVPFLVMTILYRINNDRPSSFKIAQHYSKFLVGVNSCINPIIYAKSNGEFSEVLKKSMRQMFCKNTDTPK